MWWQLKKYGRWSEVLQHLLTAEREVMLASGVLLRTLREASAPYTKQDPFASLLHDAFKFLENTVQQLTPSQLTTRDDSAMRESQRRALLAIRDVLLEEKVAIVSNQDVSAFRGEVIDSILRVLDAELVRIELSDEDPIALEDDEDDTLDPLDASEPDGSQPDDSVTAASPL